MHTLYTGIHQCCVLYMHAHAHTHTHTHTQYTHTPHRSNHCRRSSLISLSPPLTHKDMVIWWRSFLKWGALFCSLAPQEWARWAHVMPWIMWCPGFRTWLSCGEICFNTLCLCRNWRVCTVHTCSSSLVINKLKSSPMINLHGLPDNSEGY